MSYTSNKYETFCEKIKLKYPNEDLTVLEYTGSNNPARIQCNKCGNIYEVKYGYHFLDKVKEKVCRNCIPRKDTIEVGNKIKHIMETNTTVTLLSEYTKITDDLILKCNHCGEVFKRKPQVFLQSQRCPICDTKTRQKTKNALNIELFEKYHGEYEIVGDYLGTTTPTLFRHNDCGMIFKTTPKCVLDKAPCPKCKRFNSKGEIAIEKTFKKHNINYIKQKRFPELNNLLSFDFYLEEHNLLIEFQGEQHFHAIPHFGGEQKFQKQQRNDEEKRSFCIKKNIQLLEIPYTDIDKIEDILSFLWLNDQSKDVASSEAK